jgi:hypothetical protein
MATASSLNVDYNRKKDESPEYWGGELLSSHLKEE